MSGYSPVRHLNGNCTVLVADDAPDIKTVTSMVLKRTVWDNQPIEFEFVDSGAQAVEYLRNHPQTAVVLMDVTMESEAAGIDAAKTIRDELGNWWTRIIIQTGAAIPTMSLLLLTGILMAFL